MPKFPNNSRKRIRGRYKIEPENACFSQIFFVSLRRVLINRIVMAKTKLRLSKKENDNGRHEIMLRFYHCHFECFSGSGIWVNPKYFKLKIDNKRTVNPKKPIGNKKEATIVEAVKNGWSLCDDGMIDTGCYNKTPEIVEHDELKKKLDSLLEKITEEYQKVSANPQALTKDWLNDLVAKFHNPELAMEKKPKTFYELCELYIEKRGLAESHARVYRVLVRAIARYEGFVRQTENKTFRWDIHTITKQNVETFSNYLRHEKELSEKYPTLFAKLMEKYPPSVKPGNQVIEARGENTVIKMQTRLKSLFKFFRDEGLTNNNPFENLKIHVEKVGTPIYISSAERDKIASTDLAAVWVGMSKEERKPARMPLETLIQQRDIFVFHCLVGCRVGDLVKFTDRYITDGVLAYTPHKTKDSGEESIQARVPLHATAKKLIEKYRGVDSKGRLFPFVSPQRYNDALKVIFKMCGITRMVEVRNPLTGENELVPINTIASSHMARRTFVGNLYFKAQDPNLIGKMSGHVEGSSAFSRYRRIEDTTLQALVDDM